MTKIAELRKRDVSLLMDSTTIETIENDDKNLPTDVHAVTYIEEGVTKVDAVRAYKMSDIFDAYWDFGIKSITEIKSGYGRIKPNLYNTTKKKDEKKSS